MCLIEEKRINFPLKAYQLGGISIAAYTSIYTPAKISHSTTLALHYGLVALAESELPSPSAEQYVLILAGEFSVALLSSGFFSKC